MLNDVMVPPLLNHAWKIPLPSIKIAGKVAGIVYTKQSGLERAGNIEVCEGAARQDKPVNGTIADDVVTVDCA